MKRIGVLISTLAIMLMGFGNSVVKVSNTENRSLAEDNDEVSSSEEVSGADEISQLVPAGYVDLGLSVYWKNSNERNSADDHDFYTNDEAKEKFGSRLPTKAQLEELINKCTWNWTGSGYKVTGPSGNSIFLPAAGARYCEGDVHSVGSSGGYWLSEGEFKLYFDSDRYIVNRSYRCDGQSVRLVQSK